MDVHKPPSGEWRRIRAIALIQTLAGILLSVLGFSFAPLWLLSFFVAATVVCFAFYLVARAKEREAIRGIFD
jgi:hypothetical protein